MTRPIRTLVACAIGAAVFVLAGCPGGDRTDGARDDAEARAERLPPPDLRLEVDVAAREVRAFRHDQLVATHPVAVGRAAWPTRPGEWHVDQVVFNPRWTPPDEEWADDREVAEPGDPDNPLGRVQLNYDPPRSIHGTNQPESIGNAVSAGSIRVTNEVGMELARMVMASGSAERDEAFFRRVQENPRERVEVAIPNPIPIRVINPEYDEAAAAGPRAAERAERERAAGGVGGTAGAGRGERTPPPAERPRPAAGRDTLRADTVRPDTARADEPAGDTVPGGR
jgi:hypothetical protein